MLPSTLSVAVDQRFLSTPDGAVWTRVPPAAAFWRAALQVFDEVNVIGRVRPIDTPPEESLRADGAGVRISALPHYFGPAQYLRRAHAVLSATRAAAARGSALLVRAPTALSLGLGPVLAARPYGVEVVSDPFEMYSPSGIQSVLRPVARRLFTAHLKHLCAHAAVVNYVSARAFERRFPTAGQRFECSDAELPPEWLASGPKEPPRGPLKLVTVGMFDHPLKGHDVLIGALARLHGHIELTVVGGGRLLPALRSLAEQSGTAGRIHFAGELPQGEAVKQALDSADLFVLATRTEGLSRAVVEAMARALPVITTPVGGNPDLVAGQDLVPVNDAAALAARIAGLAGSPAWYREASARNLARARAFSRDALEVRRIEFFRALRAVAQGRGERSLAA
ncbi:MAG: glycosyltransferase family 4 protein [Acidobacteria bacterium]|nr:glycosyltransferase family 4 protein [Acidobacteriota bacterium]